MLAMLTTEGVLRRNSSTVCSSSADSSDLSGSGAFSQLISFSTWEETIGEGPSCQKWADVSCCWISSQHSLFGVSPSLPSSVSAVQNVMANINSAEWHMLLPQPIDLLWDRSGTQWTGPLAHLHFQCGWSGRHPRSEWEACCIGCGGARE